MKTMHSFESFLIFLCYMRLIYFIWNNFRGTLSKKVIFLLFFIDFCIFVFFLFSEKNWTLPWGGSPRSNLYFSAKPKLSVFENGQFSGHFFLDQKFKKKCKMLWGKSFGNFFDTQKHFFLKGHFFWKKSKKKFWTTFRPVKKFSKCFLNFFWKKVSWKNFFLSVKKNSKTFSP